jgi:acyl carrier protein
MDSIDALELVVRVEKRVWIKIKSSEEAKSALKSIKCLADFIRAAQQAKN